MLIGQLADELGLPPETVRFYERRGLLPTPRRAANGYRIYDDDALSHLRFIRIAQTAGLTLAEIGSIIAINDSGATPCGHVTDLLEAKLEDVLDRQRQLADLEAELTRLVDRSRRLDPADCNSDDICQILADR